MKGSQGSQGKKMGKWPAAKIYDDMKGSQGSQGSQGKMK